MDQATAVLIAALLLATGFGLWRTARDGRFRGTRAVRSVQAVPAAEASQPAEAVPAAEGSERDEAAQPGEWSQARAASGPGEWSEQREAGQPSEASQTEPAPNAPPARAGQPPRTAQPEHPLTGLGHDLGERATLLQFSSAFCAPCRTTRRVLSEVAAVVPGVAHVEVDAEKHLDLVRRVGVLRTPTTLVLDARGTEVSRASGAPTKAAVLATLGRVLET